MVMYDLDRNGGGSDGGGVPGGDGFAGGDGYGGPEGFDDPEVSGAEGYGGPEGFDDPEVSGAEGYGGPEGFDDPEGPAAGEAGGGPAVPEAEGPAAPGEADWEAEAALYKEKFLRAMAEGENARRRQEKELSQARKYSAEPILRDLIQVLENLHLALSYADPDNPAVKGLADGVGMTVTDCLNRMSDHGFRELTVAPGGAFDPNLHEAVGVEAAEGLPENSIARMLSRGYLLHDRLLRPVKVILAKGAA
jgi:molecular chaperone GrpE